MGRSRYSTGATFKSDSLEIAIVDIHILQLLKSSFGNAPFPLIIFNICQTV